MSSISWPPQKLGDSQRAAPLWHSAEIFIHLYEVVVRPQFECRVHPWSTFLQNHANCLKNVQRPAMHMRPKARVKKGLIDFSFSSEGKGAWRYVIEIYTIVKFPNRIRPETLFHDDRDCRIGEHGKKPIDYSPRSRARAQLFSSRIMKQVVQQYILPGILG